ncbi:MAG: hypothetical protein CMC84_01050 [Flavobacteriaceae bacterium]|nr:hypothetical protein [Flavobacteriaceae bacterium]|tara:strand:+ start:6064 stop:6474 length:411 start_codon:yes stop_codon:yes gene_type:complete
MAQLETEIELLKRDVTEMKQIHLRLDTAIEKIADVSSSLHTIMAVHEEKLMRQEEALDGQEKEFRENIQQLHDRISTNSDKTTKHMNDMEKRISDELQKIREELSSRVGVLEKWRWVIIGGSIVVGFIITKLPIWT